MRLCEEIFKNTEGISLARCTIVPSGGGFFEGVKGVEDFSPSRIEICFSKSKIEVIGENLVIEKYVDGDLQIAGKITSLSVAEKGV